VLAEVSPTGTITSSRNYDVYGNVRSGVNANGTSAHKFVGNLGHPSDNNTGLIYMQARYMDPATGRFMSEDPARKGNHWLSYCEQNPVNKTDTSGKDPFSIGISSPNLLLDVYEGIEEGLSFGEILYNIFAGDVYIAAGSAGAVADAIAIIRFEVKVALEILEGAGIEGNAYNIAGHYTIYEGGIFDLAREVTSADLYDLQTGEVEAIDTGMMGGI